MRVLVTGANGFVGHAAAKALLLAGHEVSQVVRSATAPDQLTIGKIDGHTEWGLALAACDVVLHLAARAHVMRDDSSDPLAVFREVNTAGALNLARQAADAGVQRFVFVSSIKVCGERTESSHPFRYDDAPAPEDAYGVSKYEAEVGLRQIAVETGMDVVVVRSPLVYGPGVKGNFVSMMRALCRGLPLPFGLVTHNRRSLVALDNLVDLLITCLNHPAAANQTFLVSDGEDMSTADLLRRLGFAMGRPARLFPVSPAILQIAANLLGKGDVTQRLLGDLQVDISHTCHTLNWKPSISVDEGLRRAVLGFSGTTK